MTKAVDLTEIAAKLAKSSNIIQKVEESGKPVNIPTAAIVKINPALQPLSQYSCLFRGWESKNGVVVVTPPTVFVDDSGNPALYTADLKPIEKVEFLGYKAGIGGWVDVKVGSLEIRCGISFSDDFGDMVAANPTKYKDPINGTPDPAVLDNLPSPETPIYTLEVGTVYSVHKITGRLSKKFQTPMVDLVNETTGEILTDVLTNTELDKLLAKYQGKTKFEVWNIRDRLNKEGEPLDAEGKTEAEGDEGWKPAKIVTLKSLCGESYDNIDF